MPFVAHPEHVEHERFPVIVGGLESPSIHSAAAPIAGGPDRLAKAGRDIADPPPTPRVEHPRRDVVRHPYRDVVLNLGSLHAR